MIIRTDPVINSETLLVKLPTPICTDQFFPVVIIWVVLISEEADVFAFAIMTRGLSIKSQKSQNKIL